MDTTEKTSAIPETSETIDLMGSVADLYTKGVERLAEMQKQALDFAVQQNAAAIGIWKKQVSGSAGPAEPLMFDMIGTILERQVETQKGVIDLVVEQSRAFAGAMKERAVKATSVGEEGLSLGREAIDQSITAQKTILDYSAQQTKVAFDTAKKQFGYAGTPVESATDSVRRGVEIAIDAQKDMLDALKTPIQILH